MVMQKFRMSGKAREMMARDTTTELVGELAGREVKQNEFSDLRAIPVSEVVVDPEQARQLEITLEMLRNPETVTDSEIRVKVEAILGLAETMSQIGQQTAIEVYLDGRRFVLVAGERRLWAARLLGLPSLNAKILPERPQRLRLKQYVENAQREGLTTRETLRALVDLIEESARLQEPILSFTALKRVTGLPNASASRWWSILSGPEDVRVGIESGVVSTVRAAEALSKISEPKERAEAIVRLSEAESRGEVLAAISAQTDKAKRKTHAPTSTRGRKQGVKIAFSTSSLEVGRMVLRRLTGIASSGEAIEDPQKMSSAIDAALKAIQAEWGSSHGNKPVNI